MRIFILLWCGFVFLPVGDLFSQGESNHWFFGKFGGAGLDFNTNPPTPTYNHSWFHVEGSSSLSCPNGKLLYYTNGDSLWDKDHLMMEDGFGLLGGWSASQAALSVPKPLSKDTIYVFTQKHGIHNGFQYSIVDMGQNQGLGKVVQKNTPINSLDAHSEKLASTYHANGVDIWVLVENLTDKTFEAYLVTAAGVSVTPVISAGLFNPAYNNNRYMGTLKFSPDGSRVINPASDISDPPAWELYDFDIATGLLSNRIDLDFSGSGSAQAYGAEFSPDGSKLYVTLSGTVAHRDLIQFDLNAANVMASNTLIKYGPFWMKAIQRGPDGKLYVSHSNNALGVVNNPNALGLACNYTDSVYNYPAISNNFILGFGHLVVGAVVLEFISDFSFSSDSCGSLGIQITANSNKSNLIDTVYWDFGEPGSAGNISGGVNSSHVYGGYGHYPVKMIIDYGCTTDTVIDTVYVNPKPIAQINYSGFDCNLDKALMQATPSGAYSYLWQDGSTASIYHQSTSQLLELIVTDTNTFCTDTADLFFPLPLVQIPQVVKDTFDCQGGWVSFLARPNTTNYTINWDNGSTDSLLVFYQDKNGFVVISDTNNCKDTVYYNIVVPQKPNALIVEGVVHCDEKTIELLASPTGMAYQWSSGVNDPDVLISQYGMSDTLMLVVKDTASKYACKDTALYFYTNSIDTSVHEIWVTPLLCNSDSMQLVAPKGYNAYYWNNGATNDTITISQAGNYTLIAEGLWCNDTFFIEVPSFNGLDTFDQSIVKCKGDAGLLVFEKKGYQYFKWSTGDTSQSVEVYREGLYWLALKFDLCSDTILFEVSDLNCDSLLCQMYIANSFTPNEDLTNDLFFPVYNPLCTLKTYEFKIFNRWGEMVYSEKNAINGWDAYAWDNGVYVWQLTYSFEGFPGAINKMGLVHLIR